MNGAVEEHEKLLTESEITVKTLSQSNVEILGLSEDAGHNEEILGSTVGKFLLCAETGQIVKASDGSKCEMMLKENDAVGSVEMVDVSKDSGNSIPVPCTDTVQSRALVEIQNEIQEIDVASEHGYASNTVQVIIHQESEEDFDNTVEVDGFYDADFMSPYYQNEENEELNLSSAQEYHDTKEQTDGVVGIEDVQGIDVICGNCSKHFHSLSSLSVHLNTHHDSVLDVATTTNIEVVQDEESSKEEASVENCDTTMKKFETNIKDLQDEQSDPDKSSVKNNCEPVKNSISSTQQKYHCHVCSKEFSSKRLLLRHSRACEKLANSGDVTMKSSQLSGGKPTSVSEKKTSISSRNRNRSSPRFHKKVKHTIASSENGNTDSDEDYEVSDSGSDFEIVDESQKSSKKRSLKIMLGDRTRYKKQRGMPDFVALTDNEPYKSRQSEKSKKRGDTAIVPYPDQQRKKGKLREETTLSSPQRKSNAATLTPQLEDSTETSPVSNQRLRRKAKQIPVVKTVLQSDIGHQDDHDTVVVITNNTNGMKNLYNKRTVRCPECSRILSSQHSLMEHMRTHTGERPFKCDECDRAFTTPRNLKKHMISIHSGTKAYKCDDCGKEFALKSSLKAHSKSHTGTFQYHCAACGKGFQTPASLRRHELIHTGERPFACEQCGRRFNDSSALKKHLFFHTGEKPHVCDKCGSSFATSSSLRYHDLVHSEISAYQCLVCGKHYRTNSSLQRHQRIHSGEKPFLCDLCPEAFAERWQLVAHHREHTGEKPFACSQCDKSFVSARKLTRHAHTHNPTHLCNYCGKSYASASFLKTHMYKHTGEHPYHCTQCPKRFSTGSALKRHGITHSGVKPFICDLCGKCFTSSVGLKHHTSLHTGDRPHLCETCGKGFPNKAALKIHSQFHNAEKQFQCDLCSKRFHRIYELKQHSLIHNDDKLFKCNQCDKAYHHKSALMAHINIHTEEKWYTCDECDKKFLREGTLRKHKKIHVAVKPHECSECDKRFVRKEHLKRHLATHARNGMIPGVVEFDADSIMNLEETSMVVEHVEMDLEDDD